MIEISEKQFLQYNFQTLDLAIRFNSQMMHLLCQDISGVSKTLNIQVIKYLIDWASHHGFLQWPRLVCHFGIVI